MHPHPQVALGMAAGGREGYSKPLEGMCFDTRAGRAGKPRTSPAKAMYDKGFGDAESEGPRLRSRVRCCGLSDTIGSCGTQRAPTRDLSGESFRSAVYGSMPRRASCSIFIDPIDRQQCPHPLLLRRAWSRPRACRLPQGSVGSRTRRASRFGRAFRDVPSLGPEAVGR